MRNDDRLVPAIIVKEKLEKEFAKRIYSPEMFWYQGYPYSHELQQIALKDDYFQWAYLDDDGDPTGYFAYRIDALTDTVANFGLYSFEEGNVSFIKRIYEHLEMLAAVHRRLEWRAIGGNPVIRNYTKFCEMHNGYIHHLHQVTKDDQGAWHDEYIFEIVKEN